MKNMKRWMLAGTLLSAALSGCGADVGEACGEGRGFGAHAYLDCEDGAVCVDYVGLPNPTCMALKELGETCERYEQCPDGAQCFKQDSNDKQGICKVRQKEGEYCRVETDRTAQCAKEAFCLDNKCTAYGQPQGAKCFVGIGNTCAMPFYCFPSDRDDPVVSYEDLDGFDPNNGICKRGGKEGERCNGSWDIYCDEGYVCSPGNTCRIDQGD
jgi:hypothetical protein